jgi:hypothetical protein
MSGHSSTVEECFLPSPESERLIQRYRSRLFEKVQETVRESSLVEQLKQVGSPFQSWLLVTKPERLPIEALEAELASYGTGRLPQVPVSPPWAERFLAEEHIIGGGDGPATVDHRPYEQTWPHLEAAEALLSELWPEAASEYQQTISRLYFYRGEPGSGGSSARAFGAIFLANHDTHPVEYANSLVHEMAHHLLNLLRSKDPLLASPYDEPCVSGLRTQKRPAWRVLHAAFSMYRMLAFLERTQGRVDARGQQVARRLLDYFQPRQRTTLEGLQVVRWTAAGAELYQRMCAQCPLGPRP